MSRLPNSPGSCAPSCGCGAWRRRGLPAGRRHSGRKSSKLSRAPAAGLKAEPGRAGLSWAALRFKDKACRYAAELSAYRQVNRLSLNFALLGGRAPVRAARGQTARSACARALPLTRGRSRSPAARAPWPRRCRPACPVSWRRAARSPSFPVWADTSRAPDSRARI